MSNEDFFKNAMEELESGNINKGLWAKCFAEVEGDENRAKAKYISTRAEALMSDQKNANLLLEGIAFAKQELSGGKLDRILWGKVWDESQFSQAIAEEKYIRIKSEEYVKTKGNTADAFGEGNKEVGLLENNEISVWEPYAAIKAGMCVFGLYLFTAAQMIFQMKGSNANFSFRVVVLFLGYYLLLGLSRLIKRNVFLTSLLVIIPIVGWGLIIYFAHQENRPPQNS